MEKTMYKAIFGALLLAASTTIALAADDSSLATKAMKDQPGTMGGDTSMPAAKSDDGNLTTKAMKDAPGTMGGSTDMPTAKPDDGNLTTKAMKDAPGTK